MPRVLRALLSAALALAALPALAAAATLPTVTTAGPRDDAGHPGPGARTEWWFANAIDPETGLGVALSLGTDMPSGPPATVVFLYLPGGGTHVVGALRPFGREVGTERADVRLGPDSFREIAPGAWRVRVRIDAGFPLHGGDPGPIAIDLVLRATTPGFTTSPLRLPEGQAISWTVAAPAARATGTVRVGERRFRLDGAPAYHDHNWGPFDLADDAHGGWDWSQAHLPGGRALAVGVVRPAGRPAQGTAVLSDSRRRLGVARRVTVTRSSWAPVGARYYPRRVRVRAALSNGWSVDLRYRGLRAAPLPFDRDGRSSLIEVLATGDGVLRRDGRVVARIRRAPAFYEYESTDVTRYRDRVPGTPGWVAGLVGRTTDALAPARGEARSGPRRT